MRLDSSAKVLLGSPFGCAARNPVRKPAWYSVVDSMLIELRGYGLVDCVESEVYGRENLRRW